MPVEYWTAPSEVMVIPTGRSPFAQQVPKMALRMWQRQPPKGRSPLGPREQLVLGWQWLLPKGH